MQEISYDIREFYWNESTNCFHADAWNLTPICTDNQFHPDAFPNDKKQFYIRNHKTNGFRRFRYIKTDTVNDSITYDDIEICETYYLFESEDGIQCKVCIHTDMIPARGEGGIQSKGRFSPKNYIKRIYKWLSTIRIKPIK